MSRRTRSFTPGCAGGFRLEPRRLCDGDLSIIIADIPPLNPGLYNPNDPSQLPIPADPEPGPWEDALASDGGDWSPDPWSDGPASDGGDWGDTTPPVPQTAANPYA